MITVNDIPMFAADMSANNIHIFVGSRKVRLRMVRGFKRIENGFLAVRFLPMGFEGCAVSDGDDVLEAICFIENAIVGKIVDGKVVDVEGSLAFDSDKT